MEEVMGEATKPRIRLFRTDWWTCTGAMYRGQGSTPEFAYANWKRSYERGGFPMYGTSS